MTKVFPHTKFGLKFTERDLVDMNIPVYDRYSVEKFMQNFLRNDVESRGVVILSAPIYTFYREDIDLSTYYMTMVATVGISEADENVTVRQLDPLELEAASKELLP